MWSEVYWVLCCIAHGPHLLAVLRICPCRLLARVCKNAHGKGRILDFGIAGLLHEGNKDSGVDTVAMVCDRGIGA